MIVQPLTAAMFSPIYAIPPLQARLALISACAVVSLVVRDVFGLLAAAFVSSLLTGVAARKSSMRPVHQSSHWLQQRARLQNQEDYS